MSDFSMYFTEGWKHIISPDALDHILFIVVLGAVYSFKYWKQVLILVTAFTIGHSLTLALSTYNIISIPSNWVEFFIPCTIALTALYNLFFHQPNKGNIQLNYLIALVFGLVHGLGFANTIRFMLASDQQIAVPLLSFNLGLEAGQILVVMILLSVHALFTRENTARQKIWVYSLSIFTFILGTYLAIDRIP